MSDSCDSMNCSPPGSSVHGDSSGKNTGVLSFPSPGDLPRAAKGFEYCHSIKPKFLHQAYLVFKFPIIALNPQVSEVLHGPHIWLNFNQESFTECCLLCARH